MMYMRILDSLNIKKQCAQYRVGLWQCPQFLFLIMGMIIIVAVAVTNMLANRYVAPEIAALIVLALAGVLFVIGHMIVSAFDRVARSARSKSEFISIISHHLRAPLSAIKWQIDVLLPQNQSGRPQASESAKYLNAIRENNERMILAVNDLLDVNRIEDNDIVLRPSAFSLVELSRGAVIKFSQLYPSRSFSLHIESEDITTMQVYADEEHIRRVIQHLMDNAACYSSEGGSIMVRIVPEEAFAKWSVADEGIGISPQDQPRIFEKFFRAQNAARHQTGGLGIGLFVAKSLVKLSRGKIGFSSAPRKGSTFWFALPIVK